MIIEAVESGFNQAKSILVELSIPAVVKRHTESYDLASGQNVLATTNQDILGVIDTFNFTEIDHVKVLQDDMKFLIVANDEIVFKSMVDQIEVSGIVYNILSFQKAMVGAKNFLYTLHLRV